MLALAGLKLWQQGSSLTFGVFFSIEIQLQNFTVFKQFLSSDPAKYATELAVLCGSGRGREWHCQL